MPTPRPQTQPTPQPATTKPNGGSRLRRAARGAASAVSKGRDCNLASNPDPQRAMPCTRGPVVAMAASDGQPRPILPRPLVI